MNEATQASYRKLAAHFYVTHLKGEQATPKRITDALKGIADKHRPDYWRRMRNALAFDQTEKGYKDAAQRINTTKNPLTLDGASDGVPGKQKRIKRIDPKDEAKLLDCFIKSEDRECYGAVMMAKLTGARPSEFKNIVIQGDRVIIAGAKKNEDGTRGADREILLNLQALAMVQASLPYLQGEGVIGRIQDRISAAGKRLWPQRTAVPSLYSWRHQMGSDLKASGLNRFEVAYVMGHQSTASVDRYGNRKTAGGGIVPRAADPKGFESVRERHSEPPAAKAATTVPKHAETLAEVIKNAGLESGTKESKSPEMSTGKGQNRQRVSGFAELKLDW